MGKVRAAQEVDLHPQVRGEVRFISTDLLPGGLVKKGKTLLRIDPADYLIAVSQAVSAVAKAEADLRVEQGRQAIARKTYALLGNTQAGADRDLVLRGPQLRQAKASLEAAQAALRRARLDLSRTTIRAPWNATVQSRSVDVGTRVTETNSLVKIIGTDAYWVELVVPVDQLRWIQIPGNATDPGARVRIRDPAASLGGASREGRVLRLAPDLEDKGRMARLIVVVDDPLALAPASHGKPRLLIGSYVQATIEGQALSSVAAVSRRLIRDGNSVWVFSSLGKLDIRVVKIVFRGPDQVLVSGGIRAGERLVVTDLAAPVQNMPLRLLHKQTSRKKQRITAPGMGP